MQTIRRISGCFWDRANLESVARHNVTPDEVEEAVLGCEGDFATYLLRRDGDYYQIFGQAGNGRLLAMVGEFVGQNVIRVFHAMDMNDGQIKAFRKR